MMDDKRLDASAVRVLRRARRWTQEELSEASGLSLRTVQRAETTGRVSFATLKSLAAVFKVDAADLEIIGAQPPPAQQRLKQLAYGCALATVIAVALVWIPRGTRDAESSNSGPTQETIAVLPFASLSHGDVPADAAKALTHDLILSLRRSGKAVVIPERNSGLIWNQKGSVKEAGDALSASMIVEGSVRAVNDRLRVTVQLVDVESEEYLWTETYDRNTSEIYDVVIAASRAIEAKYRY